MATEQEIAELVRAVIELGGRSTYRLARERLRWDEEKFREVRVAARTAGQVKLGRGKGGTIALLEGAQPVAQPAVPVQPDPEAAFYDRLLPTFRGEWAASEEVDEFYAEISARRRQRGAGRWSIPDIVFVGKQTFDFVPSFDFTVQTIEVKRFEALDELAVFEALSHQRSAHLAYLLVVNTPADEAEAATRIAPIRALCADQGVGLVTVCAGHEASFDDWEFLVDPERNEPDSQNLNGLLARCLSEDGKARVRRMVR